MRFWLRALLLLIVVGAVAIGAWWYANREELARQLGCYRVGAAASLAEAQREIAWFDQGPDRPARLAALVRRWGTGNQRFDFFLASHLRQAASSESLRETFSRELGRREELLPRWAHYWSYQAAEEPDRQITSILSFFDTLAAQRPSQEITWREVLDLQAIFQLAGRPQYARGLEPANWCSVYRAWQETRPAQLPHVPRPQRPFADWQGPLILP
jgi:hypothetical protein